MNITFLDGVLFVTYFCLLFLSIFWLLVLFFTDEKKENKKLDSYPFFSAIVPAYNEEESIGATLNSLINLDYPKDKREIVVVNDGSKDNTQAIVEKFITEHPDYNIALLNQNNKGKGSAMNKGLAIVKGKYFACLDADSFVASNALQVMLPELETDDEVAAICPVLKVQKPKSILQKVQWCEYIINMYYKYLNARLHCIHVTPGPFSVYRTEVIQKLGGFNEKTITEDLEIAIRLQKNQYKILQSFDTIVETVAPNSWKALFRQRVRWYKGSVDNTIVYRELLFNKKYGDFGMVRMPTIIFSGIIAIVLGLTVGHSLIRGIVRLFQALRDVHFDVFTLIKHASIDINWLGLPFFKLVIAGTLLCISFFVMIKSFQLVQEKITNYGKTWISLVTYLLIYSLFLTSVWVYIAYMLIRRKKNFWF
ncbi:MAG: glycosyltransferase [archaeon]|nr:glycosyltransferase [archaeon]